MIQKETVCNVADNTGVSRVRIFDVKKKGVIGSKVVFSVLKLRRLSVTKIKRGDVERGILVRSSKKIMRADGSSICFDSNEISFMNRRNMPKAKRIYGPVPRELGRSKFFAISSVVF